MEPPIGYGLTYHSIFPEPNVLARRPVSDIPVTAPEPVRVSAGVSRNPWERPEIVVGIRDVEWTPSDRLRHVVYLGEREDKSTVQVRRNSPRDDRK
jgi:ATP-dependent DNA ligase